MFNNINRDMVLNNEEFTYSGGTLRENCSVVYKDFKDFAKTCASDTDKNNRNTFLTKFKDTYKTSIDDLDAQTVDLQFINGDATDKSVTTIESSINSMKASLESEKNRLTDEKNSIISLIETSERGFLERLVTKEEPINNNILTLQDFALAIFVLGWLLMGLTIIYLRMAGPTGSILGGAVVLVIFFFASVVLYMILQQLI